MKSRVKFRGGKKKHVQNFDVVGVNLYKGDKDRLVTALNEVEAQYMSLSDFVRKSINAELKKLNVSFQVEEL